MRIGGSGYVQRAVGDSHPDFPTFTADGQYHNLTVSGIVPANAKAFFLSVRLAGSNTHLKITFVNDPSEATFETICRVYITNDDMYHHVMIPNPKNGIIQYLVAGSGWSTIAAAVTGWLL